MSAVLLTGLALLSSSPGLTTILGERIPVLGSSLKDLRANDYIRPCGNEIGDYRTYAPLRRLYRKPMQRVVLSLATNRVERIYFASFDQKAFLRSIRSDSRCEAKLSDGHQQFSCKLSSSAAPTTVAFCGDTIVLAPHTASQPCGADMWPE